MSTTIALLPAGLTACADDTNEKNETTCTVNICKDANTVLVCDTATGQTTEKACDNGCDAGACKDAPAVDKCTADVCKDGATLLVCNAETGTTTEKTCENGCDNGACKDAPAVDKCTADVCKDANTLLVCDKTTGKTSDKACENGCDTATNACKDAPADDKCTANVCKDANTLLVCDKTTGKTSDKACENGCDSATNACKDGPAADKCTTDVCKDANTLLVCDKTTGKTSDKVCENGCDSATKACKAGSAPQSGDACDVHTFVEGCNGNKFHFCTSSKTVKVVDCTEVGKESSDPTMSCAVIKGGYPDGTDYAACFSDSLKCTKENDKATFCTTDGYDDYTNAFICKKAENGTLYYTESFSYADIIYCESGYCDESGLKCADDDTPSLEELIEDTGKACDFETYSETCDGNVATTCNALPTATSDTILRINCSQFGPNVQCATIADWYDDGIDLSSCFSEYDICDEEYDMAEDEEGNEYLCMTATDGKNYWIQF